MPTGNCFVGLPSGNRSESLDSCLKAWLTTGITPIVITWDENPVDYEYKIVMSGRQSWGKNHNIILRQLKDWSFYICCNDDSFPIAVGQIQGTADKNPESVIYTNSPFSFCFPILTKGWYNAFGGLPEIYEHNYSDTDLFFASRHKAVWNPAINIEHRHLIPVKYKDTINHSRGTYERDRKIFIDKWGDKEREAWRGIGVKRFDLHDPRQA